MHVFDAATDPRAIESAIAAGEHFWLDVPAGEFDLGGPVARALGIDAAGLDRFRGRENRAGAFVAEGRAVIVFAGAALEGNEVQQVDVIAFADTQGLVTLRDGPCRPLEELKSAPHDVDVLSVLDALTDSLLSVAGQVEDAVEEAEDSILELSSSRMLSQITDLRKEVTRLLRITRSQHGMIVRNADSLGDVHVAYGDAARRVRDLQGHLAYADGRAESARQTIAEAMNLYLSVAAERLTRIATVLVPLTVVTSFFGMNFAWLTDHIDSLPSFLLLGIALPLATVAAVRFVLSRRGYG